MSAMKWTPAQEEALNARGSDLLLSAAAGSGKTAVLVERILRRITDPEDPVDVNAFLVLTFTRSAAAEMRSRVGASLSDRLSEAARTLEAHPSEENARRATWLQLQLTLLGSASISTIDAFCQSVLRQYFYLLDIDPNFRILSDDNEKKLLQEDVLSGVLLRWYEKDDPRFRDLTGLFSSGYEDEKLRSEILRIYGFSRSLAFPEDFLRRFPLPYEDSGAAGPDDFPWTAELLADFRDKARAWCSRYRRIAQLADADEALTPYRDALGAEYAALALLLTEDGETWSGWRRLLSMDVFGRLPAVRRAQSLDPLRFDELKGEIQTLRDSVKKEVKDLAESCFSIPDAQWVSDLAATRPLAEVLSEVLLDFSDAYEQRKKKEGLLEFNDTEHLVLSLLLDKSSTPDHPVRSETALALQKKYREVMVDEYQDTNDLQELITALISDGKNRFLVGDIKQSIYRFRQADPGIFLTKYTGFRENGTGRRIDLNQNFRSDPAVLSAVNFIFRQLLRTEGGRTALELDYGDAEALHPGRSAGTPPDSYIGGGTDIELLDLADQSEKEEETGEDLDKTDLEARMIAGRIASFFRDGAQVMEKDGTFRPIRYGDIVILLRAVDRKAPLLLQALRDQNIPAVCSQTDDFFASTEVQILWALLRIIDNPRQDLALAAVLRSYFVGLDEESLARLRLQNRTSLWEALHQASELLRSGQALRVIRFLDRYRRWHALSRQTGAAPLIETILRDTDYLSYLSGLPDSAFRRSRLDAFYETARTWDEQSISGLYRFLTYLQQTADSSSRLRQTAAPPMEADAVRIMTIHKSKGLEFPVVFLAGTGSRFNLKDLDQIALLHKTQGLGLQRFDRDDLCRWPTLRWYAVRQSILRESLAEEARLLYVAMTRARDRLIITGSVKNGAAALRSWTQGLEGSSRELTPLPSWRITSARCFLDWIIPAAARSRTMESLWQHVSGSPAYVAEEKDAAPRFHFQLHPVGDYLKPGETEEMAETLHPEDSTAAAQFLRAPAAPAPEWLDRQLRWTYGHPGAVQAPAKLTATAAVQLAEADKEEDMPSRILAEEIPEKSPLPPDFAAPPAFLAEEVDRYSGAVYGTLMHKAMEQLDLARLAADPAAISEEITRLTALRRFTEEESCILLGSSRGGRPVYDILAFLQSPLGELMRTASVIRKEMPFSLLLPARAFYPDCGPEETIFLQGVMDCLLEKDGRLTVIDYKTDHVADAAQLRDHYHRQLQIYGAAAERIFRKPVEALCLWSFRLKKAVPVPRQ